MRGRGYQLLVFVLSLALDVAAGAQPANDDCAAATLIGSVPFTDTIDTTTATTEPGDPLIDCGDFPASVKGKSAWYRYTAAAPVLLEVNTLGSDFDTTLVAYTGGCGAVLPVFCNDDIDNYLEAPTDTSRMLVTLDAGEDVLIEVVDDFDFGSGTGGNLVVNVLETPVFQTNAHTVRSSRPNVAANTDGNFLVVWIDSVAGVSGRLVDAGGLPQGPTFQVSVGTYAAGYYDGPSVASDGTGGFIVAWYDGDPLVARKVDASGTPVGPEIAVGAVGSTEEPHVAADAAGNFVVAWVKDSGGGGVNARRFDATGTPLGPVFDVATTGARWARIAAAPSGEFVVVWTDTDYLDGDRYGVFGRRYDETGTALGAPFQVNVNAENGQGHYGADVTVLPEGGFVVAWTDRYNDYVYAFDQAKSVLARRFDAAGVGGTPFLVSTGTGSTYYGSEIGYTNAYPAVASDGAGNFVVVWNRELGGPYGQRFRANGTPVGDVFRASNEADSYQYQMDVAANASGDFVVVWDHYWTQSFERVLGHAFAGPIAPPICPAVPQAGCREPGIALKGTLRLKDKSPDTSDSLGWKWLRGEETLLPAFGAPLVSTSYRVCVWDGASTTLLDAEIPAGGSCGANPCWKDLGADGFKYVDKAATRDGIQKLILKPGVPGSAKVIAKGKGTGLGMPGLPLALPVTAQVLASNGECWSAVYEAGGVVNNLSTEFSAKASLGTP